MSKSPFGHRYARLRAALVAARLARDLTQVELAGKLRKPQSFVSKIENGERRLDVIEFVDIARVLNTDPCDLLRSVDR